MYSGTRSRESLGWEQEESKLVVCLPRSDDRQPNVGHGAAGEAQPPLHGQTVPTFPSYVRPSGSDPRNEAYISKNEVKKYTIGARGTKGAKWKYDNAIQNEILKEKREKWWRSQRLERAARRGNPWGAQVTLHEVRVRIPPKERIPSVRKEAKPASAGYPVRERGQRGAEAESFLEWFKKDKIAKARRDRPHATPAPTDKEAHQKQMKLHARPTQTM